MTPTTTLGPATATYDQVETMAVIAHWTDVRVRAIDVESLSLAFGHQAVHAILITLTMASIRDAHRVAALLELPPEILEPAVTWQAWTGWVSEASTQCPVLVCVTAPIGASQEAT